MLTITKDNFEQEVLKSDKKVLVDFWASWCGPCRMVSPLVDELAEEHPEFKFCKVNVDEQPDLANRFKIMSIPSLITFKDGNLKDMSVGAKPKEQILEMLTSL